MANTSPCVNTGTKLPVTKPAFTNVPTTIFGTPKGEAARKNIVIQGIVIHCINDTLTSYDAKMTAGASPSSGPHGSLHYLVNSAGVIHQYVDDANVAWGFQPYNNPAYPTPANYTGLTWTTLAAANPNISPDYYVLNVGLVSGLPVGANGCVICPGPTVLQDAGCKQLVQLLAFLAKTYNITIDTEHINFHQNVDCNAAKECPCADITKLLQEVTQFCQPCTTPISTTIPNITATETFAGFIGKTTMNCCDDKGCQVCIPSSELPCLIGNTIPDGNITNFFVGLNADATGRMCLVRNTIAVTSPLQGNGLSGSPIRIERCEVDAFLPVVSPLTNLFGSDAAGCWSKMPLTALPLPPLVCTDSTSIDLTCTAVQGAGYTVTATAIIDPVAGNQLMVGPNGLSVVLTNCELGALVPNVPGPLDQVVGLDNNNCLVAMDDNAFVRGQVCLFGDATGIPTDILGKGAGECPVFYKPGPVVNAGLDVTDTDSVDHTLTQVGTGVATLTSNVIIAPAQGGVNNATSIIPGGGVYTPELTINAAGSDCITATVTPTNVLEIDVQVAPPQGGVLNQLLCVPGAGLFVPTGAGITVQDTQCHNLTILNGVISSDPIISGPIAGTPNILTCTPTGLYVPQQVQISVLDTNCIDLTINNGVISANPVIAPAQAGVNNALTCTAQGLYVPQGANLTFNDTDCVNLDLTGGVVTSTIILAGAQAGINNVAQCIPGQGFFVPAGAGINVLDTNCINLTLTGGNTISADPIISPAIGGINNALTCVGTGLYVPVGSGLTVLDTDCIDMTLTGAGVLSAVPIIAPAQGVPAVPNLLTCIPGQGLYAAPTLVADTDCIDLTLTGTTITADPILAPAQNCVPNQLQCLPTGLYVGCALGQNTSALAPAAGDDPSTGYCAGSPWRQVDANGCTKFFIKRDNQCGVNTWQEICLPSGDTTLSVGFTAPQTFTSLLIDPIDYDIIRSVDPSGAVTYDPATSTFTVNCPGIYTINGNLYFENTTYENAGGGGVNPAVGQQIEFVVNMSKNGVLLTGQRMSQENMSEGSHFASITISGQSEFVAGDTFQLLFFHNHIANLPMQDALEFNQFLRVRRIC